MAYIKRDLTLEKVSEVVMKNTGMSETDLLDDQKVYQVANLTKAADFIRQAKNKRGKRIIIFGDYDADGVTSTRILEDTFYLYSRYVTTRFPRRFSEGYGAKPAAIEEIAVSGAILVLVDNGIKAFDAVKKAKELGMEVIILDHHEPQVNADGSLELPEADIIVDPKAFGGDFNHYCGAGLALKLTQELFNDMENKDNYIKEYYEKVLRNAKALAAIGTVCDSVPLIGENRRIVKEGMEIMNQELKAGRPRALKYGLFYLLRELGLEVVNEKAIGFKIGPCINAWGRLEDDGAGLVAASLKSNSSMVKSIEAARNIIEMNEQRKETSEKWFDLTVEKLRNSDMEDDYPIVVHMDGMPEGIAGLIAGKISETYRTPSFIFTDTQDSNIIKGSARTDGDTDINALLSRHQELLVSYGGHTGAAGVSIRKDGLEDLREALMNDLGGKPALVIGDRYYDLEIKPSDIPSVMEEVLKFGPYGENNPAPEFLIKNLYAIPTGVEHYKELARNGIKLITEFATCITFDATDSYKQLGAPKKFDAIGTLSTNQFKGNVSNQFEMIDLEPSKEATSKPISPLSLALKKAAKARTA